MESEKPYNFANNIAKQHSRFRFLEWSNEHTNAPSNFQSLASKSTTFLSDERRTHPTQSRLGQPPASDSLWPERDNKLDSLNGIRLHIYALPSRPFQSISSWSFLLYIFSHHSKLSAACVEDDELSLCTLRSPSSVQYLPIRWISKELNCVGHTKKILPLAVQSIIPEHDSWRPGEMGKFPHAELYTYSFSWHLFSYTSKNSGICEKVI